MRCFYESHHAPWGFRNRTGRSGKPKKGGGGGKYTWGALSQHDEGTHSLDPNDPNYNSDDEYNPVLLRFAHEDDLLAYKQTVWDTN